MRFEHVSKIDSSQSTLLPRLLHPSWEGTGDDRPDGRFTTRLSEQSLAVTPLVARTQIELRELLEELNHPGSAYYGTSAFELGAEAEVRDVRGRTRSFPSRSASGRRLRERLAAVFEVEPVEDGYTHPAEEVIEKAVQSPSAQDVLDELEQIILDAHHLDLAVSVLRILGRIPKIGSLNWRVALVREALQRDSVALRDAAAQAAESWGDEAFIPVLEARVRGEQVPWLRQYLIDILHDLGV